MKTNKTTQIINHLKRRKSLTSWDAIKLYGATRLSAVIFNLRKRGYIIKSVYVEDTDRYGNTCRYVKYIYKGMADGHSGNK